MEKALNKIDDLPSLSKKKYSNAVANGDSKIYFQACVSSFPALGDDSPSISISNSFVIIILVSRGLFMDECVALSLLWPIVRLLDYFSQRTHS